LRQNKLTILHLYIPSSVAGFLQKSLIILSALAPLLFRLSLFSMSDFSEAVFAWIKFCGRQSPISFTNLEVEAIRLGTLAWLGLGLDVRLVKRNSETCASRHHSPVDRSPRPDSPLSFPGLNAICAGVYASSNRHGLIRASSG